MTDVVKKAIEQLERISNSLASIGETVDYTDIAIQALEQEPCNDAISREEVLRHRHVVQNNDWIGCCVVRVDEIIKLPSVTPKAESEG